MLDEHTSTPAEEADQTEWRILDLLLNSEDHHPWALEEIVRKIGNPTITTHAIAALQAAGLIHGLQGFFFPTRAAVRFEQLSNVAI